jgi:hypothetical protein
MGISFNRCAFEHNPSIHATFAPTSVPLGWCCFRLVLDGHTIHFGVHKFTCIDGGFDDVVVDSNYMISFRVEAGYVFAFEFRDAYKIVGSPAVGVPRLEWTWSRLDQINAFRLGLPDDLARVVARFL